MLNDTFDAFQPDVLVNYGGYTSNFFAGQYALMRGRRSVLFAASATYRKPSDFTHVNLVVAISKVLAAKLAQVTTLPVIGLSPFVRRADVIPKQRSPEYITFINPTIPKGLKLAADLTLECQRRKQPYKFLFVESRGTKASALKDCPELAQSENVTFVQNTSNVAAVYERTRILLFPSLWFETAGRVAIEANANGIPVMASRVAGIPEMLNGAGYLFDPPQEMAEEWSANPPSDYVEKWLGVLDRLHDDPQEAADAVARAQAADSQYDLTALAQRFVNAVMA